MTNITLSVPEKVYKAMKKHEQIGWNKVAKKAIVSEIVKLEMVEGINRKGKLTVDDMIEIGERIKRKFIKN